MSPIQTTYVEGMPKAAAGLVKSSDHAIHTGVVETTDGIGFGLPVAQGAADNGVIAADTLAKFLGISVRDVTVAAETDKYPRYANMGYLKRGQIWVVAGAQVVAGDPVHFNPTGGVWLKTGQQGPIPRARYATSAAIGEFVLIEIGY